ncbi:hypothetical protein [Actinopolymorpha alba]|uniref:hypothetical protein n=1 Tax=Actinopolymorpha alba TaxID=533267 RepID=UPI00036D7E86|nr:hypothetical protein [Actinopolymorpha alba]
MKSFVVTCANRPGEIAKVVEAVAARGINMKTASSVSFGDRGAVGVLTEDEAGTRMALEATGMEFRECETVNVPLEDRPGTLADACRRLADADINVDFLAPTTLGGTTASVAFGVEDAEAAHKALSA